MIRKIFARQIGLAVLLGLLVATVSAKTLLLNETDNGTHLCLNTGDTIVIKLKSNETTGYSWSVTTPAAFLEQIASEKERAKDTAIGAGGFQTFKFKARSTGEGTLELKYFRPFEKDKPAAKTYKITVSVTAK